MTKQKLQFNGIIPLHVLEEYIKPDKSNEYFFYSGDIKKTCKHYGIFSNESKTKLLEQLVLYIKNEKETESQNNLNPHIKNQTCFQGPGINNPSLCVNEEDFYTLEHYKDLPEHLFFSIQEKSKHIYYFDIRSFKILVEKQMENPYTNVPIEETHIDQYHKRIEYLEYNNFSLSMPKESIVLTPEQKFNFRVLEVIGKINDLNLVAGGFQHDWFKNLSRSQLINYYLHLEDIWNYRANLNEARKLEIIPNKEKCKKLFPYPVNFIRKVKQNEFTNRALQLLNLEVIETLITSSPQETHRSSGGYYCLIAFTLVSDNIAQAIPWLVQQ